MKRKILYVSGSRADYGLMRSVLFRINNDRFFELHIAATGMHLIAEFGHSIDEIRVDGLTCHVVNETYEDDTSASMALFIGKFIEKFVPLVTEIKPDLILLLGDRGEMLGGAITGAYLGIPVVHIHGGERTATIDESARHAITKLAHIHLAATRESAERIIKMGEDPENVHIVGAPGLDEIAGTDFLSPSELSKKYNIDLSGNLVLVIQHPVTLGGGDAGYQMQQTLDAVTGLNEQAIVVFPNADAGGRAMIEVIKEYRKFSRIHFFSNIPHRDFLSLLKISSVIVGNSSSGIIEAPFFHVPCVNIGTRQLGRERGDTVIDSGYDTREIQEAIRFALTDPDFSKRVKRARSPYGDGRSGKRIVEIMKNIPEKSGLVQKRMMY